MSHEGTQRRRKAESDWGHAPFYGLLQRRGEGEGEGGVLAFTVFSVAKFLNCHVLD